VSGKETGSDEDVWFVWSRRRKIQEWDGDRDAGDGRKGDFWRKRRAGGGTAAHVREKRGSAVEKSITEKTTKAQGCQSITDSRGVRKKKTRRIWTEGRGKGQNEGEEGKQKTLILGVQFSSGR